MKLPDADVPPVFPENPLDKRLDAPKPLMLLSKSLSLKMIFFEFVENILINKNLLVKGFSISFPLSRAFLLEKYVPRATKWEKMAMQAVVIAKKSENFIFSQLNYYFFITRVTLAAKTPFAGHIRPAGGVF